MNSTITFPPVAPVLKLTRPPAEKWAATLAEERRRLQEDHEALREREANLRDYEARLRALQAELEAGRVAPPVTTRATAAPFLRSSSKAPFMDDAGLQAAWEKLHRAREILEAEQRHMRDERIVLSEKDADVQQRAQAVAAREARVAAREELIAAATPPATVPSGEPVASEHTMSAVTRLTRAPFNLARSVFRAKE
jgi:DNA repair exonuclease SbcCD ATPase subunit